MMETADGSAVGEEQSHEKDTVQPNGQDLALIMYLCSIN